MKYFVVFVPVLMLWACQKKESFKEEELIGSINLNEEFGTKFGSSSLGEDYLYQAFFDLGTNENVSSNSKEIWDLGFSCDAPHVILNSAKSSLRAARIPVDWDMSVVASDWELSYDLQTGSVSDLCIGNQFNETILLDRGVTSTGEEIGVVKVFVTFDNGTYTVLVSDLLNTNEQVLTVQQNNSHSYIYLNVEQGVVDVAPAKNEWDLLFTHYLHVYDPLTEPFPYQVTGCLLNTHQVVCMETSTEPYEAIDRTFAETLALTDSLDVIGFDWKYYDFDLGFITDDSKVYVIQDTQGDLYKLRFTSFYNSEGMKGHPQFEFQKIP